MNEHSQETLHMVEQNDPSLVNLFLSTNRPQQNFRCFNSSDARDFSRLGAAIGANTHITGLAVWLQLTAVNSGLYDGLKRNTSINRLGLVEGNIVDGILNDILKVYWEPNNNLSDIRIVGCNLENGGDGIIATTLKKCINLKCVALYQCNITDEKLMPIVEGIRGHRMLEVLDMEGNRIGDAGCDAIAALLEDPSCTLQELKLARNNISTEGATTIANSLTHNTKLKQLCLEQNQIDTPSARDVFSKLLCNTSSINDTYSSNHKLKAIIGLRRQNESNNDRLRDLFVMNTCTNKSHVAIKKILRYHPNIDMEPLFLWDSEGEQTLKELPYVLAWFEKAEQAVGVGEEPDRIYNVGAKKLSAIYQFAKAMPQLIVSLSPVTLFDRNVRQQLETKIAELEAKNSELEAKIVALTQKKRKRDDGM